MAQFNHDEKLFLESYAEFTVNVRPYIIKKLCQDYKNANTQDEKDYLRILALEQWFLLYETFEGFFRAIKNRKNKSIFDSLNEDLNIQNLYESLRNKSDEEILIELNVRLDDFSEKEKKKVQEMIKDLASLWKNEKFSKLIKALIPIYNKLKHKLLVYRKDGTVIFLLNQDQERELEKFLIKYENSSEAANNLDYCVDMAELFKTAIKNLIDIRLLELQ